MKTWFLHLVRPVEDLDLVLPAAQAVYSVPMDSTPMDTDRAAEAAGSSDRLRASTPKLSAALREMASDEPLTITVRGDCMTPWLRDGDRVAVCPRSLYWPGDVIAFHDHRGRRVVHRVIGWRPARDGLRLLTQADAAPSADSSVPRSRVLGRAQLPVPWKQRLRAVMRFLAFAGRLLRPRRHG